MSTAIEFNFDFVNVSDIQNEDLRKRFETTTSESVLRVVGIIEAPNAPGPLTCTQIMAVYGRAYGEDACPTMTTVRSWLNRAKAAGLISKPSKQTYGVKSLESVECDESDDSDEASTEIDPLDPLA